MSAGSAFIINNYKTEHVLQCNNYSCTELVMQAGVPYVRKTINAVGLPYAELKKLKHPCLPHVFYAVEVEGKTYVIEEYISGRTLAECLEQRLSFSAEQQLKIAEQLCSVLELLHSRGILHRDIKPSNIIVMHDLLQVKLIDFGIGRSFTGTNTQELQDTCIMGTPGYAPPEQYGFSATDQRSDIYSLGKTLLELQNEASEPSFIKALQRCLEFDPAKRYQSVAELQQALKGTRRHFSLQAAAFGLAAVLLVAAVFLMYKSPESTPGKKYVAQQSTSTVASPVKPAASSTDVPQQGNAQAASSQATPQQGKAPAASLTKPPASTVASNTSNKTAQQMDDNDNQVKLKQVGYEWWFDKATLQVVDAKDNIFRFKGIKNRKPLVTVENVSDYPAVNPVLKLELYSFGMKAANFTWQTDAEHKERVEFSKFDRLGVARRVTLYLEGTIAPHTRYTFSGLQNVDDFYIYYKGNNGTVLGNLNCDNMLTQSVGYAFKLQ